MVVILLSPPLARRFGKKAIAVAGFGLSTISGLAFYLLEPANVNGMVALTVIGSILYAPTIPLIWAIFADCADYSEWKTGRRFTGIVFATIGFALKAGLALGNSSFLWTMKYAFHYDPSLSDVPEALRGFRICSGTVVGIMFAICTVLLMFYKLNKKMTIRMADELAERRRKAASAETAI
jgi:Na+/melibiose symporter-like transporter